RPRIVIVSTAPKMWPDDARPKSMGDFVDPKWKGRASIAKPLTGTTLTHAVVLYSVLGKDRAVKWFEGLFANACTFPSSNGPVARGVGEAQVAFGFTDIDDFRAVQ